MINLLCNDWETRELEVHVLDLMSGIVFCAHWCLLCTIHFWCWVDVQSCFLCCDVTKTWMVVLIQVDQFALFSDIDVLLYVCDITITSGRQFFCSGVLKICMSDCDVSESVIICLYQIDQFAYLKILDKLVSVCEDSAWINKQVITQGMDLEVRKKRTIFPYE